LIRKQRPCSFGFELSLRKSRGALYKLINPVAKFLDRARQANMFIVYTVADRYKGTAEARMPHASNNAMTSGHFPAAFDNSIAASFSQCCRKEALRQ